MFLRKDLGQLPGRLQERQLGLLTGEIGVEKGDPFVVFVQAGLLDFLQRRAILIELGLLQLQSFLGQLQVEARNIPARVQLAHSARFLLHVEANFLPLVAKRQLGGAQLAFGQRDTRPKSSRQTEGIVICNADVDVIAIEMSCRNRRNY